MCRLLAVTSTESSNFTSLLEEFAEACRSSKEYQGHGWGCAYMTSAGWKIYKSLTPIWKDDMEFIPATTQLLVHARSAFQDEGIEIGNNMPFRDSTRVFAFNGELRGVKLKEEGRIGAEKLFHFINRFDRGDYAKAMSRAVPLISKRSEYIRAMNIITAEADRFSILNCFNEDPAYFQLFENDSLSQHIICSEKLASVSSWTPISKTGSPVIKEVIF